MKKINSPRFSSTPFLDHLDRFQNAWDDNAPEAVFGKKTLVDFMQEVKPSRDIRHRLAFLSGEVRAGIADRNNADKITLDLLNRMVAGVKSNFGSDSALYRAMGYVPSSERKLPVLAGTTSTVSKSHESMMARLDRAITAWGEVAPEAIFVGKTLDQFKVAVAGSYNTRAMMVKSNANYRGGIMTRKAADAVTRKCINRVVACIIGDDAYGDNCALYRALGYITANERRSPKRALPTGPAIPAT